MNFVEASSGPRALVSQLGGALFALVAPPQCAACRRADPGGPLCRRCRAALIALPPGRCRRCGAPAPSCPSRCRECRGRRLAFTSAWAAFEYEGPCVRAVAALKTRGDGALAALLAAEIARRCPPEILAGALVAVPAHPARRRRHGFNQAELIARALGRHAGLPVVDVLECRRSRPQIGLERHERIANARGAARARRGAHAPARAVLVDDVYTTGATLDACASALRAAGAREVQAVTVARAIRAVAGPRP